MGRGGERPTDAKTPCKFGPKTVPNAEPPAHAWFSRPARARGLDRLRLLDRHTLDDRVPDHDGLRWKHANSNVLMAGSFSRVKRPGRLELEVDELCDWPEEHEHERDRNAVGRRLDRRPHHARPTPEGGDHVRRHEVRTDRREHE